jgi:hypothetical protein
MPGKVLHDHVRVGVATPKRSHAEAEGTAYGARRIDDPQVIAEAGREVAELYTAAEPLLDYFVREIAPLPAPVHQRAS